MDDVLVMPVSMGMPGGGGSPAIWAVVECGRIKNSVNNTARPGRGRFIKRSFWCRLSVEREVTKKAPDAARRYTIVLCNIVKIRVSKSIHVACN